MDREREQLENRRWVLLSLEVIFYLIRFFSLCPINKIGPILPLKPEGIVEEHHILMDMYSWAEFLWNNHGPVRIHNISGSNQLLVNNF